MREPDPQLVNVSTAFVNLNDYAETAYPNVESILGGGVEIHDTYVDILDGGHRRRFLICFRSCPMNRVNIGLRTLFPGVEPYGELIVLRVGRNQVFANIKSGTEQELAQRAVHV